MEQVESSVRAAADVQVWHESICRSVVYVRPDRPRTITVPSGAVEVRLVVAERCIERHAVVLDPGSACEVRFDH